MSADARRGFSDQSGAWFELPGSEAEVVHGQTSGSEYRGCIAVGMVHPVDCPRSRGIVLDSGGPPMAVPHAVPAGTERLKLSPCQRKDIIREAGRGL